MHSIASFSSGHCFPSLNLLVYTSLYTRVEVDVINDFSVLSLGQLLLNDTALLGVKFTQQFNNKQCFRHAYESCFLLSVFFQLSFSGSALMFLSFSFFLKGPLRTQIKSIIVFRQGGNFNVRLAFTRVLHGLPVWTIVLLPPKLSFLDFDCFLMPGQEVFRDLHFGRT